MATKRTCNRCGAEINPASESIIETEVQHVHDPLSLEELKAMIGEPVWVVVKSSGNGMWVIVDESWICLSNGYTAYRSKTEDHFR